ncbi:hypothetical protein FDECE_15591 [Fusarium decemcellulare]|nr:hypothetical protein FDECE_15591 [Fusarium decemcellulare]
MWDVQRLLWPTPYWQESPPPTVPDDDPDLHTLLAGQELPTDWEEDEIALEDIHRLPPQTLPLIVSLIEANINPQPECPLFRLPREIRLTIWELATATVCDPDRPYDPRHFLWRPDNTGPRRVDRTLLRACRAIYAETWDLPLKQTPIVIHDGSESDRPRSRIYYPFVRGQALFYLQAWQILLIQHVEMTFSQNRLGGRAIQEWVKVIAKARLIAKEIIKGLTQDLKGNPNAGVLAQIPQRGITSLVVKVNRRDWWTWTEAPDSQIDDNNPASGPPRLRLERHGLVGWTHQQDLFAGDFAFTLMMETFGAKREQLERVVDEAKQLTWCTGSSRQLVWDGVVRDLSWDRVSDEVCAWLKKEPWKKTARRIEVRAVRYVLKEGHQDESRPQR